MSRIFDFTHAILRRPGGTVVKGLRAGGGGDPALAGILREHAAYAAALAAAGLDVTMLGPLEDYPDAIFVEDPALVFPEAAILLNPGAPSRAGEGAHLRAEFAARFAAVLDLPAGHADGGDVLVLPGRILIGLSARTDRTGAEALVSLLEGLGRRAEVAETPRGVLHQKNRQLADRRGNGAGIAGAGCNRCVRGFAGAGSAGWRGSRRKRPAR